MKQTLLILVSLFLSCTPTVAELTPPPSTGNPETPMTNSIQITINNIVFTATLAQNTTAKALLALLPLSMNMHEINGNEKYYYLPKNLPTNPTTVTTIRCGDIMLYGSTTLVLFYDSFQTSYNYTPIGRVDNPSALMSALGNANVSVKLENQPL